TTILIRLKDYKDAKEVRDYLRARFPEQLYVVSTWEDKQGPLLGAIAIEKGLLNILLFLIIAVAGFGILAIFTMIVREKTNNIDKFPVELQPWSLILINVGSLLIAVLFSIFPALRAAMLHPVRALRYE